MRSVGIVANEFFDESISRMGGFGWVARSAAEALSARGATPYFLSGDLFEWGDGVTYDSRGVELLLNLHDQEAYRAELARRRIGTLLTVDYRASYDYALESSDAPVVMWVQDPRPPEDVAKVDTLEIPGRPGVWPDGISHVDCTGLADMVHRARAAGREVLFASPAPGLLEKVPGTYGLDVAELHPLPYSLDLTSDPVAETERPSVVFLGRLDPVKRPWVFAEVARRFPAVDFVFMGKAHFEGEGAWAPSGLPDNVRFAGHVEGVEKERLLSSAWLLVNSSIHEALPVSFVEALASRTPIVSCQDPEHTASRFGVYVGRWDGSGMEGVDDFAAGVEMLLDDPGLRARKAEQGREWALSTHGREHFLAGFSFLARCLEQGELAGTDERSRASGSGARRRRAPSPG